MMQRVGVPEDDDTVARLRAALRAAEPAFHAISGAALVWSGRNEGRVDARLRDGEGREHHVVARERAAGLTVELVLTEPDDVPRRDPVAVVVNGPSGAGKSTLLEAISTRAETPWVTFDEPILGTADRALLVWPARAPHLHDGFLRGIAAVAATGTPVAVAGGGRPQEGFQAAMHGVRVLYVGLDCPTEVLVDRERGRDGRWGGLALQSLGAHDGWTYDLRFDTSQVSAETAAVEVLVAVAEPGVAAGC